MSRAAIVRSDGDKRLTSTKVDFEVVDFRGAVIARTERGTLQSHEIVGDLTVPRGTPLKVFEHRC